MLKDELYSEIRRAIWEETQKFTYAVTERCISLIEEYSEQSTPDFMLQEDEPPCIMPVLDSVDDIISVMSESFEKARQKQEENGRNYNL